MVPTAGELQPGSRIGARVVQIGYFTGMTGTFLTPVERANLHNFRLIAAEVTRALQAERPRLTDLRIVNGYIESDAGLERVRALCIPVRRTYLKRDPINFNRILDVVARTSREEIHQRSLDLIARYEPIREELESISILNDRRVTHAEMFEAWIDAMVFFEAPDKVRRYQAMLQELGKPVEGIATYLMERIAEQIVLLDDLVADFLGEPRVEHAANPSP